MRRVALAVLVSVGVIAFAPPAAHAGFPGANGTLVFPLDGGVKTINPDGTGLTSYDVVPGLEGGHEFSPDGKKLVLEGTDSDFVYTVEFGGPLTPVATDWNYAQPTWSPDGSKVAAVKLFGCPDPDFCHEELWTMNADGTNPDQIVSGWSVSDPAWSPDGSQIAFARAVSENDPTSLYTAQPDGTDATMLFSGGIDPNWSPDGTQLVFTNGRLMRKMNADGSGVVDLSGPLLAGYGDQQPVWSPDGQKIAFKRRAPDSSWELYTMNSDGSGKTAIFANPTDADFYDRDLDWQPLVGVPEPYPRPGGATPLRVPLVPVFTQCTTPNSQHAAPLGEPSCEPPTPESSLLTTSTTGRGQGSLRMDVQVGDPSTPADEADVRLDVSLSDVHNAHDQSDYSGFVLLHAALRITDRRSGSETVAATVQDTRFDIPVTCTPTAQAPNGSNCALATTADSLVAGYVKEGKRTIVSAFQVAVMDAGPDGQVFGAGNCLPTCGTGDEERFQEQGTFAP